MGKSSVKSQYIIEGQDRSAGALRSAEKNMQALVNTSVTLTGALASIAGVAGMGALVKGSIDAGDKIQKLSIRLGASTEALSEYQHVAELTGVTFQSLTTAWQRQTRRIAEANKGTGEAVKALDELGLSAGALVNLAPEQQFEVLADALNGVSNQADRVRLAMKFWDSEGVSLLQTVDGGSASLREMREQAQKLGLTLSREQVDKMAAANDAISSMQASLRGMANDIAIAVGPSIVSMAQSLGAGIPIAVEAAKISFNGFRITMNDAAAEFNEFLADYQKMRAKVLPSEDKLTGQIAKRLGFIETEQQAIASANDLMNTANEYRLANVEIMKDLGDQQDRYNKLLDQEFTISQGKGLGFDQSQFEGVKTDSSSEENKDPFIPEFDESILADSFSKRIEYLQEHQAIVRDIIAEHNRRVAADEKQAHFSRLQSLSSIFGSMSQLVTVNSKRQFKKSQQLARVETFISMIASAQKAYESMARFGPVAAAGAAGAALLAGGVRLKQINSASFNSGGGGGASSGASGGAQGTFPAVPGTGFPVDPNRGAISQPAPVNHITIQLGDRTLAEAVVEGNRIADQNDMQIFQTENGFERVRFT